MGNEGLRALLCFKPAKSPYSGVEREREGERERERERERDRHRESKRG